MASRPKKGSQPHQAKCAVCIVQTNLHKTTSDMNEVFVVKHQVTIITHKNVNVRLFESVKCEFSNYGIHFTAFKKSSIHGFTENLEQILLNYFFIHAFI